MLVAYSLVAGITYPGNATVPFGVFRPVIIERLSLVLIVGATLVVHFMIQQSRVFLQARAYQGVHFRLLAGVPMIELTSLDFQQCRQNIEMHPLPGLSVLPKPDG